MRFRIPTALLAATLLVTAPAFAQPKAARVAAIHRCSASCSDTVSAHDIVSGRIKIDVSVSSGIAGLDRVRLEARPPGTEDYICLQQWFGDRKLQMDVSYEWDTPYWPKPGPGWGCPETTPHYHGEPASNGDYLIRVQAYDVGDNKVTDSADFPVRLANVPAAPSWLGTPTPTTTNGRPVVLLRWKPNREKDIAEYHFRRSGPDGKQIEFAVDATNPDRQGCYKSSAFYGCPDTSFDGSPSGEYSYSILALRPTPGSSQHCGLSSQPCTASPPSETMRTTITSSPGASSSASPGPSPGASVSPTTPAASHPAIVPAAVPSFTASPSPGISGTALAGKATKKPAAWPITLAITAVLAISGGTFWFRRKGRLSRAANKAP